MKEKGFTLVELAIVLSIIGILLVVAGFQFTGWIAKERLDDGTNTLFANLERMRARSISEGIIGSPITESCVQCGEPFDDTNGNCVHAAEENFTDLNGNGNYDGDSGTEGRNRFYGLMNTGTGSYRVFQFCDLNFNFIMLMDDTERRWMGSDTSLPSGVTFSTYDNTAGATDPCVDDITTAGVTVIFDKKGMPRTNTWGGGEDTITLNNASGNRQIVINSVGRMRILICAS